MQSINYGRWEKLSRDYDCEVFCIGPKIWFENWFGVRRRHVTSTLKIGRFNVIPTYAVFNNSFTRWLTPFVWINFLTKRPDFVVLLSDDRSWNTIFICLCAKLLNIKTVCFSQDHLTASDLSLRRRFTFKILDKLNKYWFTHNMFTQSKLIDRGVTTDKILVCTQVGCDENLWNSNDRKNVSFFLEAKEAKSTEVNLLFVGRVCEDKGIRQFLLAYEKLNQTINDYTITAKVIGSGDLYDELRVKYPTVEFTGLLDFHEVAAQMRKSDLLIVPSQDTVRWVDTFPLVISQSMLCETPVISTKSPGATELLDNYWLVDKDVESIVEKIENLVYTSHADNAFDVNFVSSFDRVKNFSTWSVINKKLFEFMMMIK